ncbi:MAG: efflux RND transporter periplasmic adaptor subunit [Rhodocyclaceae bacterium]
MRFPLLLILGIASWSLIGCNAKPDDKKPSGPPATLVTTTRAQLTDLEITEDTLGTLESVMDPTLRAEVAGRVLAVQARAGDRVRRGQSLAVLDQTDLAIQDRADGADVRRLEALLAQQERLAQRQLDLVGRGFISQNAADDAVAQRDALKEQLASVRARGETTRANLGRTRILAPLDGVVETQIVAVGDYVKVGDPLFKMVSNQRLRAHLPFPETVASRMRRGLPVRIGSPQAPGTVVNGTVDDLRPTVTETSRALEVIARFDNPGGLLLSGGTVNASVVVDTKKNVVVVPEQSVVLRPAGKVVYALKDGKAVQRVVETGFKKAGAVEVVRGLQAGETVILDGAGFLTDGAPVNLKDAAPGPSPAVPKADPAAGGKAEKS